MGVFGGGAILPVVVLPATQQFTRLESQISVHLTAVGDPDDGDNDKVVLDYVDHAVVSDAEPHRSRWVPL